MHVYTYILGGKKSVKALSNFFHTFIHLHIQLEKATERESYVILSVYTLSHENVTRSIEWVRVQLPEHNTPEVNDMIMLGKDMQSFN